MGGDPFFDVPNNLISDKAKRAERVLAERHGCPIELDNVAYAYTPFYAAYGLDHDEVEIYDRLDSDDPNVANDACDDDDGYGDDAE